MEKIINLTQHAFSKDQIDDLTSKGIEIIPLDEDDVKTIRGWLTFDAPPSIDDMLQRASMLAAACEHVGATMAHVGGAPYFMAPLCACLQEVNVKPIYGFTQRVSVENPETGEKTSVFKHAGWVDAF